MAVDVQKEKIVDVKDSSKEKQLKRIEVPLVITVRDLAKLMAISPIEIIKVLMNNGIMANINQRVDFDTISIIGEDMGYEIVPPQIEELEEII